MSTFTPPTPLTERITYALVSLRQARHDGSPETIYVAQRRLDDLCERVACRPLALIDPALDKHLRVDMQ